MFNENIKPRRLDSYDTLGTIVVGRPWRHKYITMKNDCSCTSVFGKTGIFFLKLLMLYLSVLHVKPMEIYWLTTTGLWSDITLAVGHYSFLLDRVTALGELHRRSQCGDCQLALRDKVSWRRIPINVISNGHKLYPSPWRHISVLIRSGIHAVCSPLESNSYHLHSTSHIDKSMTYCQWKIPILRIIFVRCISLILK